MGHLEHLKVVHRDLAARNVLVDQHDRAKVADFGLAVCLQDDQSEGLINFNDSDGINKCKYFRGQAEVTTEEKFRNVIKSCYKSFCNDFLIVKFKFKQTFQV